MPIFDSFEQMAAVSSGRLDFQTLVEAGHRLPIAFKDYSALMQWAKGLTDFGAWPIGRRRGSNIITIAGQTQFPGRYYRQVWARARYKSYRPAMMEYYHKSTGGLRIGRYDIDHAVASHTLLKQWPDAWVNVLYVEQGINRSIGAMMEKSTSLQIHGNDRILFNAECLLKMFFDRTSRLTYSDVPTYMDAASKRFLTSTSQGATNAETLNAKNILGEIYREINLDPQKNEKLRQGEASLE